MTLLEVSGLDVRHGLLQAVRSVDLQVGEGERVALVGANGAGKTTLLRTVAGALRPDGGAISFAGRDITRMPAHRRVQLGISLVPEGRRLFPELTVQENLIVAGRHGPPGDWTVDRVLDAFPMLQPVRSHRAATLSGGEQQATAIGRALMNNPRLILLDEVSLGLAPVAVEAVYSSLRSLLEGGAAVLLVEQDLGRAMSVADRVVCMLEGRIVLQGPAQQLSREQVTEAYFGLRRPGGRGERTGTA
jgi:branched-chain amino acid transport system ATP-binding protein